MSNEANAIILSKDVAAVWDESIDWSNPKYGIGADTIASSSWSIDGNDDALEVFDEAVAPDGLSTSAWFRGGTVGFFYTIKNSITTVGGRVLPESFVIEVVSNNFIPQS